MAARRKPGRPSQVNHAMVLTAAKLVLNVDARAGNRIASTYSQPSLRGWLESRRRADWPTLVSGDIAYGNEEMMAGCEQRELPYVFKLRQTKRVAGMLTSLAGQNKKLIWHHAGGTGRESRRVRWFKTQLPAGANSPIGQD